MMNNYMGWEGWSSHAGVFGVAGGLLAVGIGIFLAALIVWSLVWKGLALWKAARLGHKGWFVALLVVNTAGILDILYLYVFSRKAKPTN